MIITSIRIYPFSGVPMTSSGYRVLAYASVHLEKDWRITHIRVIEAPDGRRIVEMPSIKNQKGEPKDVAYPITEAARQEVKGEILAELKRGRFSKYRDEMAIP